MSHKSGCHRYISFSNAWFRSSYTGNKAFAFTNRILNNGIPNRNGNWEVALVSIDIKNLDYIGPDAVYRVECSFINPYQAGEFARSRTIGTFSIRPPAESTSEKLLEGIIEVRDVLRSYTEEWYRRIGGPKRKKPEEQPQPEPQAEPQLEPESADQDQPTEDADEEGSSRQTRAADADKNRSLTELHVTMSKPVYFPVVVGDIEIAHISLKPLFQTAHTVNAAQVIALFHFRERNEYQ